MKDYNEIILKSKNNIKLAIQFLEMKFHDIPLDATWKNDLKDIIKYDKSSSYVNSKLAITENTELVNP